MVVVMVMVVLVNEVFVVSVWSRVCSCDIGSISDSSCYSSSGGGSFCWW